jgi:hypothetical protein
MTSTKTEVTWSDVEKIIRKVIRESRSKEMKAMAKAIESLATYMKEGFEESNKRLEAIETTLLEHSKRLEAIETTLLEHSKRLEAIGTILLEHGGRLEAVGSSLRDLRLEVSALGERFGYGFEDVVMRVIAEVKGLNVSKADKLSLIDGYGEVFGIPAEIRFDVYLSNGDKILVEVKSRCRVDDVLKFYRKVMYAEKMLKEKFKMIIIAVAFDKDAYDKCRELGIETIVRSIIA